MLPWHRKYCILQPKWNRCQSCQYNQLECLLSRYDIVERSDIIRLLEESLDVTCQDMFAENMGDGDTNSGSDDSDGNAMKDTIEVATGEVDHNVAPDYGEADQGVEANKDEEHGVWRL